MYLPPPRVFKPPRLASSKAGNLVAPLLFLSFRVIVPFLDSTVFDKPEPVRSLSSRRLSPLSRPSSSHHRLRARLFFAPPSVAHNSRSNLRLRRLDLDSLAYPLPFSIAFDFASSLRQRRLPRCAAPSCFHFGLATRLGSFTRTHRVTLTGFAPYNILSQSDTLQLMWAFDVYSPPTAWGRSPKPSSSRLNALTVTCL
jgi:hypothetical protein